MKKTIAILGTILCLSLCLAGCSGTSLSSEKQQAIQKIQASDLDAPNREDLINKIDQSQDEAGFQAIWKIAQERIKAKKSEVEHEKAQESMAIKTAKALFEKVAGKQYKGHAQIARPGCGSATIAISSSTPVAVTVNDAFIQCANMSKDLFKQSDFAGTWTIEPTDSSEPGLLTLENTKSQVNIMFDSLDKDPINITVATPGMTALGVDYSEIK